MATTEAKAITKEALASLRNASTIVFRHGHGITQIEGSRKGIDYTVEVDYRFVDYSEEKIVDPDYGAACFEMFHFNHHDSTVNTFLRIVRPGDNVCVLWVRDNNSDNLRKAGLHKDQLEVLVRRPTKGRTIEFRFLLSVSACPDNTARMIQRASR